ncbi:winged helix-turn-helix transcriptional regulator [Halogeometricum sp. S1BR25-6]|uniref:Winged helix-turn-helix transcriptional regulator n=1 Tax=Halogeometricum salsisoli TaxID=2950536 RepID=A0ABU2GKT9_9EURY|nr:winged helix-turn-helix transcriptional regulator [Halogeometricum sp. S1BR25-6]MDS0301410.1 winged helix-turn-helix transcriptional regulator [Halogeometricum sp. S1BR25-6]
MNTRERVATAVRENPGIHFNELRRRLELANGQVQYHVRKLKRAGEIDEESYFGRTHYYAPDFDPETRKTVAMLRRETARDILSVLLENGPSRPTELIESLGIARSSLEYHLNRLIDCELVEKHRGIGNHVTVAVDDRSTAVELLELVRPSFPDRMVDRFTRLFDGVLYEHGNDEDES